MSAIGSVSWRRRVAAFLVAAVAATAGAWLADHGHHSTDQLGAKRSVTSFYFGDNRGVHAGPDSISWH